MFILLVIAGLCFAGALVVLAEAVTPSARRRQGAVAAVRRFAGRNDNQTTLGTRKSAALASTERLGSRLATSKFRDRLPQRLAAAGLAGRVTPEAFIAFRAGLVAVAVVGGFCLGAIAGVSGSHLLLLVLVVTAVGVFAPGYVLERRIRLRREKVHEAFPDALDLLAVTVEAGLGLYGAIERYVATTEGPLADEFALVMTEMRVGDSSERALKRMATRLQSQEVSSLVRALVQGEQLGLSLARTLRNLAEDTRNRRRAAAEELASKAPVKMLVPAALFIFPALFVVVLGPAVLELKKYL